jgi:hypothetical protein
MTAAAQKILEEFEALDEAERQDVIERLLQFAGPWDSGPLTDEEITGAAAALFAMYDAEEGE